MVLAEMEGVESMEVEPSKQRKGKLFVAAFFFNTLAAG